MYLWTTYLYNYICMYVLYVVILTYKASLAGRGLYNTTVFILIQHTTYVYNTYVVCCMLNYVTHAL